jgi:hypothetical protein
MTLHISDDLITSDQVASHAQLTRRSAESRGTWRVSYLPGRSFTREDAIAAVQLAEARAVFFRLWDAIHRREQELCVFDEDAFRLNRELATTSAQGAAPTPPRTVTAPCHPATSNGYEVIPS